MAGFFDALLGDTPEKTQALGLLGAGLMAGNAPGGFQAAQGLLTQAPMNALKKRYMEAQLAETMAQADERKANLALKQRRAAALEGWLGQLDGAPSAANQSVISQTGNLSPTLANAALQSQSFGKLTAGNPLADVDPRAARADMMLNDGKNIPEWLFKRTTPDMQNVNGVWVNKNTARDGDSLPSVSASGQATQIVRDPSAPGGYRIITPQGSVENYGLFKGVDALLGSAGKVNLRKNADGTETPVSEFDENPALQRLLSPLLGGAMPQAVPQGFQPSAQPAPRAMPQAAPQSASPAGFPRITPEEQRGRDAEAIRVIQSEILSEKDPATRAGLQRELDRMTSAQARPGFPAASAPATRGQGYGKTTAQETAEAADKAATVKMAEASATDIAETRKTIMNGGLSAPGNIAKYQQIGKLLADVDGGALTATGTNLASAMNSIGIKIDKNLPNKEAAAALGNEMALELRNPAGGAGMPGAMSDKDREFLQGMIPNANQSAQGRKLLIDAKISIEQRKQQVATFARNYEKKYGRLDNGFFEQLQSWSNANSMFGGK